MPHGSCDIADYIAILDDVSKEPTHMVSPFLLAHAHGGAGSIAWESQQQPGARGLSLHHSADFTQGYPIRTGTNKAVLALPRIPSAVDFQHMAGDKAAGIAGQKDDRAGQLMRLSPAAHRRALANKPVA